MEKGSTADENNVTADTFSHTSNTQKDNSNSIFTSEKLDKSDELSDVVKDLTINNAKYYESKTETASDSQGDPARNTETVTHTSNGNEIVTHTSNMNFVQKVLSYCTIPAVVPTMSLRIYQRVVSIVLAPHSLLMLAMNEVVTYSSSVGVWVYMTPRKFIRMGTDGSTPGDIGRAVSVKHAPSPVMVVIFIFPFPVAYYLVKNTTMVPEMISTCAIG